MLTFESIRDVERGERDSKRLQRLPENWHEDLRDYVASKESRADKTPEDMLEIQNVKSIINRLLDLREKKVIDQALITVRTGAPPENLMSVEEKLFWEAVESLKSFRGEFLPTRPSPKAKVEEKKYKITKSLPAFLGPDMKTYSLKAGEVLALPEPLIEVLKKQGAVEEA